MSLVQFRLKAPPADLAHLVERDLAKVEVAGSSPVIRSKQKIRLRRKADFLFCIIHCSHIIRRKLKPIEKAETSLKFALFGKMQVLLDKIQSKFCCILVRTMILYQRTCGNLKGSEKMLSDNIREYRKKSNMSQDELAESWAFQGKVSVFGKPDKPSRQLIISSLWQKFLIFLRIRF